MMRIISFLGFALGLCVLAGGCYQPPQVLKIPGTVPLELNIGGGYSGMQLSPSATKLQADNPKKFSPVCVEPRAQIQQLRDSVRDQLVEGEYFLGDSHSSYSSGFYSDPDGPNRSLQRGAWYQDEWLGKGNTGVFVMLWDISKVKDPSKLAPVFTEDKDYYVKHPKGCLIMTITDVPNPYKEHR